MRVDKKFIIGVGQANGLASLDGSGKVPVGQLPAGSTIAKEELDTSWDGSTTLKNVTVSALTDARSGQWALHDNANDYARIYCDIRATSTTNVRITVSPALPVGNYRLVGIG